MKFGFIKQNRPLYCCVSWQGERERERERGLLKILSKVENCGRIMLRV